MPWYVTAYVLLLVALAAAGMQISRSRLYPTWLTIGDALSYVASIALVVAYWHERWRLGLGRLVVPLFLFTIAWLVVAAKPALELALDIAEREPGGRPMTRETTILSFVIGLLIAAPAMIWGFRVFRAEVGF